MESQEEREVRQRVREASDDELLSLTRSMARKSEELSVWRDVLAFIACAVGDELSRRQASLN